MKNLFICILLLVLTPLGANSFSVSYYKNGFYIGVNKGSPYRYQNYHYGQPYYYYSNYPGYQGGSYNYYVRPYYYRNYNYPYYRYYNDPQERRETYSYNRYRCDRYGNCRKVYFYFRSR